MFKAKVTVTLKESILDPQGKAVELALKNLNYDNFNQVRIGKIITLDINESDQNQAETKLKEICDQLLSNPVIENYTYELSQ